MDLWSILSFSYSTNRQGQRGPVWGLYIDNVKDDDDKSISALEEQFISLLEWMGCTLLHISYAVMFPGKCQLRTKSWWYVAFVDVLMPFIQLLARFIFHWKSVACACWACITERSRKGGIFMGAVLVIPDFKLFISEQKEVQSRDEVKCWACCKNFIMA